MFPLNWNIPFIRKNGSRTTLGAITGDIAGLTDKTEGLWDNMKNNGAVNIAKITAVTQTVNGVTFTIDPDTGKVTASNNAASANIRFVLGTITLKAGATYKLSDTKDGKTTGTVNDTLAIRLPGSTWLAATDGTYSNLYTPSADTEVQLIRSVNSGLTPYSECYPMITVSSYNGDYVPYAMSNRELTEEKLSLSVLKSVVADSSDFADFKTKIAAL